MDFFDRVFHALPDFWSDDDKLATIAGWRLHQKEPEIIEAILQRIEECPSTAAVYDDVEGGVQQVLASTRARAVERCREASE